MKETKFSLGSLVATANAAQAISSEDILLALGRHASGDWGSVGDEDKDANESALSLGERLLSVYESSEGIAFWVITEADRSITTVLLPEDY